MLTKLSTACAIVILSLQAINASDIKSQDNNNFNVLIRNTMLDQRDNDRPQSTKILLQEAFNSINHIITSLIDDKVDSKTIILPAQGSHKVQHESASSVKMFSGDVEARTIRFKNTESITKTRFKRSYHASRSLDDQFNSSRKRGSKNIPKFIRNKIKVSNATSISRLLKCPKLRYTRRMHKPTCTRGRALFSRCEMKCKDGYYSPSPTAGKFRRCKKTSRNRFKPMLPQWTGRSSNFKCVPICNSPPHFRHGKFNCQIVGQEFECKFSCEKNFKLWGSVKRKCISNTTWTGDPPSCTAVPSKSDIRQKMSIGFQLRQNFTCGNVESMTSFTNKGIHHMVATDYKAGKVKIYKWEGGQFLDPPVQEIDFFGPMKAVVLTDPKSTTWLMVANAEYVTFYRLKPNGLFTRSHSNDSSLIIPQTDVGIQKKDAIAFAELRGEIYRCYGRNRRASPFVVVQKLQGASRKSGKKSVFHRIMRKRLSDEYVQRCSMYTDRGSIYTIVALNKNDGRGRIIIGEVSNKNRGMKVVNVISGDTLRNLSDAFGFNTADGNRYIVASQNSRDGQCLVYQRIWKPNE